MSTYIPSPGLEDALADAYVRRDWQAYTALTRRSQTELAAFHASQSRFAQHAPGLTLRTVAATPATVPEPPSLTDAVRTARGLTPASSEPHGLAARGVPEPPKLADAIRAARAKEVR